jgi:hypothetical protein
MLDAETKNQSGRLRVTKVSADEVEIALEVTWNPASNDDGFYLRNGVIEAETIPLRENVALYRAPSDDPRPCTLVLVFTTNRSVEVSQFGECSWFGVGVNATGRYIIKNPRSKSK